MNHFFRGEKKYFYFKQIFLSAIPFTFLILFSFPSFSQIEARQIFSKKIAQLNKQSCLSEDDQLKKQIHLSSMLVMHGETVAARGKLKKLISECKSKKCRLGIHQVLQ